MKNSPQTDTLESKDFFIQNMQWVSDSVQLLKTKDISNLYRDISKRALEAHRDWQKLRMKKELTLLERQERKRLHQTLQVVVPASRRCIALLRKLKSGNSSSQALSTSASRLAVFLLGMVAQSSLLSHAANIRCMGAKLDTVLPAGLTLVHRSVALDILRENATLFGACPAWVEQVVVNSKHMSAATAMKERYQHNEKFRRLALRNKIISLGVLTADEEQILMRVLHIASMFEPHD